MNTEGDWKKYSARVHEWRERYLERRNRELVEVLLVFTFGLLMVSTVRLIFRIWWGEVYSNG